MRKLRWPIAIFSIIVLLSAMLALSVRTDPMPTLRHYITEDNYYYFSGETMSSFRGKGSPAMEFHRLEVHDISDDAMEKFLREHFSKDKGWSTPVANRSGRSFFESNRGGPGREVVRAFRGPLIRSHPRPGDPPFDYFSIEIARPLSSWDIALLKLRSRGKDPFRP